MSRRNTHGVYPFIIVVVALLAVALVASLNSTTFTTSEMLKSDPWADSYAQWTMAFAAIFAAGISVWGVIIVRDTLNATREASEAAGASARAAIEANTIALQGMEMQNRPYFYFSGGQISVSREEGVVRCIGNLRLTNGGTTPAITSWWADESFYRINGRDVGSGGGSGPRVQTIAPGQYLMIEVNGGSGNRDSVSGASIAFQVTVGVFVEYGGLGEKTWSSEIWAYANLTNLDQEPIFCELQQRAKPSAEKDPNYVLPTQDAG